MKPYVALLAGILVVGIPARDARVQTLEARLDRYVGAYRVSPHGTMALSRFEHDGNVVHLFTDFTDGWRGVVEPGGGDTLRIVSHGGPDPEARPRIVLGAGSTGRPTVSLHLDDRPTRIGGRIPLRIEPVAFVNDGIRLAGEIVVPPGPGPHPGIVFVHGSGPATRNDYREWSRFFAANGFAAFVYDKRGAGASEGDYREASFHDLAADAAAALRRLREHPDVDSLAVGLSGGSQGAWVAPIAAGIDDEIAFLIPTGGGPITPAEQEIYRRARVVEDAGYDAEAVETARALVTLYFDYLGSGGGDAALAARVAEAWARHGAEPWFDLLDLPARDPTVGEWPRGRRRFAEELFFDPAPSAAAITVPTLAILGGDDQGFPTPRTAAAWRELVGPTLLEVWVIPGVDHGFWVADDPARGRHQSPRLFEGMLAWAHRTLAAVPPPADQAAVSGADTLLPGLYALDDGELLVVERFDLAPHGEEVVTLGLLEPSSGTIRALRSVSDSSRVHGRGMLDTGSPVGELVERRDSDGTVRELVWRLTGEAPRIARPVRTTRRVPVRFASEDVELAGSLVAPVGPGPHPGVVMVHGSGPGGRYYLTYGLVSRWLASLGFAVLGYDKRGYGESSGPSWDTATIPDLAGDVAAAVGFLRTRPEIDLDRIGIWGHSQGGWTGPLAATMSPVAFLVLLSAPAVGTWEQEIDTIRSRLRAAGASPAEVSAAVSAMRTMFEVAATGEGIDGLREEIEISRDASWRDAVPLTADPAALGEWRRTRYRPGSVLRRLRIPTLVLFGAADEIVPPDENAPAWRRLLSGAGDDVLTVRIFPEADHGLLETSGEGGHGTAGALAPDVLETIARWLGERVPDVRRSAQVR